MWDNFTASPFEWDYSDMALDDRQKFDPMRYS